MAQPKIVSRSGQPFQDRREAGRTLAREMDHLRGQGVLVLGIPRGGVVVAKEVADALEGELDIVLARKLRAPGRPELAIGAVAESGKAFVDPGIARRVGADESYLDRAKAETMEEIRRRAARYREVRPRAEIEGRTVVVTDDGIATGSTLQASLWTARQEGAERLVAAVPVGPPRTVEELAELADEFLCLRAPVEFGAVGQFYVRFDQTTDEEVLELLRSAAPGEESGS